jgi:hypothetical protein
MIIAWKMSGYWILFDLKAKNSLPNNWYDVLKTNDYGFISYSTFRKEMDYSVGSFIQYIMQIIPDNYPDFLPETK